MARRAILTFALVLAGFGLCFAADPQMGTWKLNEAKSKLNPNAGKNVTVVYSAAGDSVKVTVNGVDKDGKPTHNEWRSSGIFPVKAWRRRFPPLRSRLLHL